MKGEYTYICMYGCVYVCMFVCICSSNNETGNSKYCLVRWEGALLKQAWGMIVGNGSCWAALFAFAAHTTLCNANFQFHLFSHDSITYSPTNPPPILSLSSLPSTCFLPSLLLYALLTQFLNFFYKIIQHWNISTHLYPLLFCSNLLFLFPPHFYFSTFNSYYIYIYNPLKSFSHGWMWQPMCIHL